MRAHTHCLLPDSRDANQVIFRIPWDSNFSDNANQGRGKEN
jgi:hypothetical protein